MNMAKIIIKRQIAICQKICKAHLRRVHHIFGPINYRSFRLNILKFLKESLWDKLVTPDKE